MSEAKLSPLFQGEIDRLSRRISLGKRRLARGIDKRQEAHGTVSEKEIVSKLEAKVAGLRKGEWSR